VLKAAGSKWNFLPFRPGLVGGHCIGVDPYYLTHNGGFFVQCRHDFGLLLKSYQQILTDMQRGEQMTQTKARQMEKTQTAVETHNGALAILKAKGLA